MTKREDLSKFKFRLSDEAWEAFEKYLRSQPNECSYCYSCQQLLIIREIIQSHTRDIIDSFSKKNKDEKRYIPYFIANKNKIDQDVVDEFFDRLSLSLAGAELFIEELRKDLFFQAKRYGKEWENGLIWNPETDSVLVACYDKPEQTFAEKFKLGKGSPIRNSLSSRIKVREIMKRGY